MQPKTGEKLTHELNCQVYEACKYRTSYILFDLFILIIVR